MNFKIIKFFIIFVFIFFTFRHDLFAQTPGSIYLSLESGSNKFAPGEFISFSIKLLNFGSLSRGDVILNYQILNDKNVIVSSSETVAVETTASFVKRIPLPNTLQPGNYTLATSLIYPGQKQPAESRFNFIVENKIIGLFQSDLIILLIISTLIFLVLIFIFYLFIKKSREHSIVLFDYSDRPKNQIIYYDILGNIINQMRLRIGNSALEIAQDIPDLEIDSNTGKIINIKKEPAKIIALLIYRFEIFSGQKISFGIHSNIR